MKNPTLNASLITDLHDALAGDSEYDHEMADILLTMARYPPQFWVPSCSRTGLGSSTGS